VIKELPGTTIIDFDGTVTDAEKESEGANVSYNDKLAKEIGIGVYELVEMFESAYKEVLSKPGLYGWEVNGLIVAPAISDPYVLHGVAAGLVIERLRQQGVQSLNLPNENQVSSLLNRMYKESYPDSGTHFKPGAKEFINDLKTHGHPVIVTNSEGDAVMTKLNGLLGVGHELKLVPDAKKYIVDLSWERIEESLSPTPHFPRPVFVRRPNYHGAIGGLNDPRRAIGDIYELDLVLPQSMGLTTVLVTVPISSLGELSPRTPNWERDYYQNHPNGFMVEALEGIIPGLLALK